MFGELTRWNPLEELREWHRDMDDLFGRFFSQQARQGWMPPVETYKKEGNYVVRVDLPGVDPKDVDIHVDSNILTIAAERKTRGEGYDYRETFHGRFERRVTLPGGVEVDKITARYENGVLEVTVPVPEAIAGKKIPIQVEGGKTKTIESKAA